MVGVDVVGSCSCWLRLMLAVHEKVALVIGILVVLAVLLLMPVRGMCLRVWSV